MGGRDDDDDDDDDEDDDRRAADLANLRKNTQHSPALEPAALATDTRAAHRVHTADPSYYACRELKCAINVDTELEAVRRARVLLFSTRPRNGCGLRSFRRGSPFARPIHGRDVSLSPAPPYILSKLN